MGQSAVDREGRREEREMRRTCRRFDRRPTARGWPGAQRRFQWETGLRSGSRGIVGRRRDRSHHRFRNDAAKDLIESGDLVRLESDAFVEADAA